MKYMYHTDRFISQNHSPYWLKFHKAKMPKARSVIESVFKKQKFWTKRILLYRILHHKYRPKTNNGQNWRISLRWLQVGNEINKLKYQFEIFQYLTGKRSFPQWNSLLYITDKKLTSVVLVKILTKLNTKRWNKTSHFPLFLPFFLIITILWVAECWSNFKSKEGDVTESHIRKSLTRKKLPEHKPETTITTCLREFNFRLASITLVVD